MVRAAIHSNRLALKNRSNNTSNSTTVRTTLAKSHDMEGRKIATETQTTDWWTAKSVRNTLRFSDQSARMSNRPSTAGTRGNTLAAIRNKMIGSIASSTKFPTTLAFCDLSKFVATAHQWLNNHSSTITAQSSGNGSQFTRFRASISRCRFSSSSATANPKMIETSVGQDSLIFICDRLVEESR